MIPFKILWVVFSVQWPILQNCWALPIYHPIELIGFAPNLKGIYWRIFRLPENWLVSYQHFEEILKYFAIRWRWWWWKCWIVLLKVKPNKNRKNQRRYNGSIHDDDEDDDCWCWSMLSWSSFSKVFQGTNLNIIDHHHHIRWVGWFGWCQMVVNYSSIIHQTATTTRTGWCWW